MERWLRNVPASLRSYLSAIVDRADPDLLKKFSIAYLQPRRKNRVPRLLLKPRVEYMGQEYQWLDGLRLLSQIQREGIKRARYNRPPTRLTVFYDHVTDPGQPPLFMAAVHIPHPSYGNSGPKKVLIPYRGLSLYLDYRKGYEKSMATELAKWAADYPDILANNVAESIGAYYVRHHYKKGDQDVIPLRSLLFYHGGKTSYAELDLLLVTREPRIELYEIKGLGRHANVERSLKSHKPVLEQLSQFAPTEYHLVVVGARPSRLDSIVDYFREVLEGADLPVERRGVHAVRVRDRKVVPHRKVIF